MGDKKMSTLEILRGEFLKDTHAGVHQQFGIFEKSVQVVFKNELASNWPVQLGAEVISWYSFAGRLSIGVFILRFLSVIYLATKR